MPTYELDAVGIHSMRAHVDAWKIIKGTLISCDNNPAGRFRRCSDQEVVSSAWLASTLDRCKKERVLSGYAQVVRDDSQCRHDVFYKVSSRSSMALGGHFHSYQQLRDCDGGNCYVVSVIEGGIQVLQISFCIDEERRVE